MSSLPFDCEEGECRCSMPFAFTRSLRMSDFLMGGKVDFPSFIYAVDEESCADE